MKKVIMLVSGLMLMGMVALGQTDTTPTTVSNMPPVTGGSIVDFVTTGSNYWAAPFATFSTKSHEFGYGVAVGYKVSQSINPVLRLDDFAGRLWVVSGNLELQPPKSIMGKFPVIPFAIGGVATSFGGNGGQNGAISGVIGAGAYFEWSHLGDSWLCKHTFSAVDYERWFNLPANQQSQIRIAPFCLKF